MSNPKDVSKTFIYHVADGKMEDMKGVVSKDGKTITFTTDHFSTYVLVQDTTVTEPVVPPTDGPDEDKPVVPPTTDVPETGDYNKVALWSTVMATSVVALAFVVVCEKRRKLS